MVYEIHNANASMALGSYKRDTIKRSNINTDTKVVTMQYIYGCEYAGIMIGGNNYHRIELNVFNVGDGNETAPRHTSLNYYIYVY